MKTINADRLATVTFQAAWEDNGVAHTVARYAGRVNFWRDLLPKALYDKLQRAVAGEGATIRLRECLPEYTQSLVYPVSHRQVRQRVSGGLSIAPRFGRFYPKGILSGLPGIFRQNMTPFRCVDVNENGIAADFNHPLAGKNVRVSAVVEDVREKFEERGGTANDWVETVLDGAGIQSRWRDRPTDFFPDGAFARQDEREDGLFYENPRFVNHIDDKAIEVIRDLYGRLLAPQMRVLDLMSSWMSHLPDQMAFEHVSGLGMNTAELAANDRLSDYLVHDVNTAPRLPYADESFDAVICTVSVEYLTSPFDIFEAVRRVLKPDGYFILTFSNRWFAPKVIGIWPELHMMERMGLVLEYFHRSRGFDRLNTFTVQGHDRPETDKYYPQMLEADPVFAVWGQKA
ncbi:MAG: methyltransferase domain-containing protein [Thermodesulfobacteriota bacterium]